MIYQIMGTILILIGLIFIYRARNIVKKLFSFGEENEAALVMKILGFVVSMVGTIIIYINIK